MTKKLFPSETKLIPISQIDENPQNPRSEIGDTADLEASITSHGLLQPITVRPVGKRFQVVAGSRRFEALKKLGYKSAKCEVRKMTDAVAFEIATAENVNRREMNPADECLAVARMVEDGLDVHTVAARFGRQPRWVIGRMKMAGLGEKALEMVKDGSISLGHAEILTMADEKNLDRMLNEARFCSPQELKSKILAEKKNLANAPFNAKKFCAKCQKQTIKDQDIFGDIAESYCLDGDCFVKRVKDTVEHIKKQLMGELGLKPVPEEWEMQFRWNYSNWVKTENEETTNDENKKKIQWLRDNGFKPYFLIDENTAQYETKWNLDEFKDSSEDDEEEMRPDYDSKEYWIDRKAHELAAEEETAIVREKITDIMCNASDEMVALILDLLEESFIVHRPAEDGEDGENGEESWLLHVGESDNPNEYNALGFAIGKLTDHYNSDWNRNQARAFWGIGDKAEFEKRVKRLVKKATKIVEEEMENEQSEE